MSRRARSRKKRRALLVGINQYRHLNDCDQLAGCLNDVASMRKLLARLDFDSVTELVDREAGQAAILRELNALVDGAEPGDLVTFYFSGHGSEVQLKDPATGAWARYEIICSANVALDGNWSDGYITDQAFMDVFNRARKDVSIELVLDSCHSAGMAVAGASPSGGQCTAPVEGGKIRYVPNPALKRRGAKAKSGFKVSARKGRLGAQCVFWGAAKSEALERRIAGKSQGAFTHKFCELIKASDFRINRAQLYDALYEDLSPDERRLQGQLPQLWRNAVRADRDLVLSAMPPGRVPKPIMAW